MGIVDLYLALLGTVEMFIVTTVGLGIVLSPIAALIFWKFPHIYEACRSYAFSGAIYKKNMEASDDIKQFGEWAGFKDTTPPTSP